MSSGKPPELYTAVRFATSSRCAGLRSPRELCTLLGHHRLHAQLVCLPVDPPNPQVAALKLGQQLLEATKNQEGAQNRNYVARKEEELSGRIQAAESDAQQHHLVLTWGLN